MLRKVADRRESYGETAVAFRKVLNKAVLTGSVDDGLRIVAQIPRGITLSVPKSVFDTTAIEDCWEIGQSCFLAACAVRPGNVRTLHGNKRYG